MIQTKQVNFERSNDKYVPLSGLDMISTHFLIYDTSDICKPKLILAMRNCYKDRSDNHGIPLPIENYISSTPLKMQRAWEKFNEGKSNIVDCNAWFVDPEYSFKKTGIPLSDLGFFMVVSHVLRMGLGHLVGVTNEKYKASRWVEPVGDFEKGLLFNHPSMNIDHAFILLEPFNKEWFVDKYNKYKDLHESRMELIPSNLEILDDEGLKEIVDRWSEDLQGDVGKMNLVS